MDLYSQYLLFNFFTVSSMVTLFNDRSLSLFDSMKSYFEWNPTENKFFVYPEENICKSCEKPLTLKTKNDNGFFLLPVLLSCRIYIGICCNTDCNDTVNYSFNGDTLGFVNFNNSILIGDEMIQEYMNLFSSNGLPFNSW